MPLLGSRASFALRSDAFHPASSEEVCPMKITAAVTEKAGGPFVIQELELGALRTWAI